RDDRDLITYGGLNGLQCLNDTQPIPFSSNPDGGVEDYSQEGGSAAGCPRMISSRSVAKSASGRAEGRASGIAMQSDNRRGAAAAGAIIATARECRSMTASPPASTRSNSPEKSRAA